MQPWILKIFCFCLLITTFGDDNGVLCQFVGNYVFSTIEDLEEALQNDPKLREYFDQETFSNPQETLSTTLTFGGNVECPSTTNLKDNSEHKDTTTAMTKVQGTTAPRPQTTAAMTKEQSTEAPRLTTTTAMTEGQSTTAPRQHTTAATTKIQSTTLPDGWNYWPYGNRSLTCKFFNQTKKNYKQANKTCSEYDGRLAATIIRDFTKEEREEYLPRRVAYWIGLQDIDDEKEFVWADGGEYNKSKTSWGSKQPDNYNADEDCVHVRRDDGMLNDAFCSKTLSFVCEKEN